MVWLWLAVDPLTKLIPVLHHGARTQDSAHAVVHDLQQRLAPGCIPVFTSDGLNLYFYALTAHFGQWMAGVGRRAQRWQVAAGQIYGQVKKTYRRRNEVGVIHVMRWGGRQQLCAALQRLGLSGRLNTCPGYYSHPKRNQHGLARHCCRACFSTPLSDHEQYQAMVFGECPLVNVQSKTNVG